MAVKLPAALRLLAVCFDGRRGCCVGLLNRLCSRWRGGLSRLGLIVLLCPATAPANAMQVKPRNSIAGRRERFMI
jgi:hypothetical protein